MKVKIINIMLSAAVVLTSFSCSDFLDREPLENLSGSTFWKSEADADRALTACYSFLRTNIWGGGTTNMSLNWEGLSDNAYAQSTSAGYTDIARGIVNPAAPAGDVMGSVWNQSYRGISACNYFLANVSSVPGMTTATRNRMRGEAMFMRAWYYHELALNFGEVPLVLTNPGFGQEVFQTAKAPNAEVVKQILTDLDSAIAYLPNNAYTDGHAVKGTALGYKTRVLLFNERWAEAEQAAAAIIEDPARKFRLHSNYEGIFFGQQDNNPEIMFSIKYSAPDNLHQMDLVYGSRFSVVPHQNLVDAYEQLPGWDPATPLLNRDPRLKLTIYTKGDPWAYHSKGFGFTGEKTTEATPSTGYGLRKYVNRGIDNATGSTISEQDFVKLRYADVLLMYAEAMVMQGKGNDPKALAAVNAVRARPTVQMPALTSLDVDQIRRERRVELAFEGLRYYDLKRWRIAETVIPTIKDPNGQFRKFEARHYLWPVPQGEVDIMGSEFQNPAY
jgi:starch-binding outer membrane protein, SusD/RagB family